MAFNQRERYLLILVVICIALLAGDKLIISPLFAMWKDRSARIEQLEKTLVTDRSLAKRKDSLEQLWEGMLKDGLPKKPSIAEDQVLKSVSNWTRSSRVNVISLKPRWGLDQDDLHKLDCRLSASGDLNSIARFLYELEKDPLALRVEKIELAARDNKGKELSLDLQFSGLILEDKNEKK